MKKTITAFLLTVFFCIGTIFAQAPSMLDQLNATLTDTPSYAKINRLLTTIEKDLRGGKIHSADTSDYLKGFNDIQAYVNDAKSKDEQELSVVQKRIDALGAVPKEGETEAAEIARKRKDFNSEADKLKAKIAEADLINTKIEELDNLILATRNRALFDNILTKESSIFHPEEFVHSIAQFAGFLYEIMLSPVSWYKGLDAKQKDSVKSHLLYITLAMVGALVVAVFLGIFIKKRFGYRDDITKPDYSQKVFAGLAVLIARGLIPALVIGAFLLWLINNPLMTIGSFGVFLKNSAMYLLTIFLSQAVVSVLFTPDNTKWRLLEIVDNDRAKRLSHSLLFSIIAISICSFFKTMAMETAHAKEVLYSLTILSNAVKAFCIALVSFRFLYDNTSLTDEEYEKESETDDFKGISLSSKISIALSFIMGGVFFLSLLGYISLSQYILDRFILSVLIIGALYIINNALLVVVRQVAKFRFWTRTFRISRKMLAKVEFWVEFILNPITFIFGALVLLAIWGVSVDILFNSVKKFLTGFDIGGVRISITSILMGIAVFFLTLWGFKLLKGSLKTGTLSKVDMDDTVRNSVASGLSFLGFIISPIFAIAVVGGSFGSIAIVFGALSFGAGLGLQGIVSNLVSGIIILFERPIRIGDWVIINGQEGIVKQINIRATRLETWAKASVVIPNSVILSGSLINMTYPNRMGRVNVKVNVSYDSDISRVKEVLLAIGKDHPQVLNNPGPYIAFNNLGDGGLDFELGCYIANASDGMGVSNAIRENIVAKFKDAGIEIPVTIKKVTQLQMSDDA